MKGSQSRALDAGYPIYSRNKAQLFQSTNETNPTNSSSPQTSPPPLPNHHLPQPHQPNPNRLLGPHRPTPLPRTQINPIIKQHPRLPDAQPLQLRIRRYRRLQPCHAPEDDQHVVELRDGWLFAVGVQDGGEGDAALRGAEGEVVAVWEGGFGEDC